MKENSDFGQYPLNAQEAQEYYMRCIQFLDEFYTKSFDLDAYMPVVKDGREEDLNKLQFANNYVQSMPISANDKATMVMWTTQAAFWLGYLEGKRATENIDLPKGFFEALGE